jgi:hypothetical protein
MAKKKKKSMDERIAEAIGEEPRVIYSAYKDYADDEEDEPIDNLDDVAVKGNVVLIGQADEFWGGKESKDYRSPVLKNPTWLEVAIHANEMIKTTLDEHHVFLEGLSVFKKEGKVTLYEFDMGS